MFPAAAVALFFALLLPRAMASQAPAPDYVVRVTVRDSSSEHRLVGHLASVAPDSLVLRVSDTDSLVGIDRHSLVRIERRMDIRMDKAMVAGCLALGGVFGFIGSQVHDPDSPGIEKAAAIIGSLFGCGLGALGGIAISSFSRRYSWEEITL